MIVLFRPDGSERPLDGALYVFIVTCWRSHVLGWEEDSSTHLVNDGHVKRFLAWRLVGVII